MTWDVTVEDVAATIGHLPRDPVTGEATITSQSSPTRAATEAWIMQVSARVANTMRAQGVDPAALTSTSTGRQLAFYQIARGMVIDRVAGLWVEGSRETTTSYTEAREERYEAELEMLSTECRNYIGDSRPTGPRLVPVISGGRRAWDRDRSFR